MALMLALAVGFLVGSGVYLLLRARTFDVILGLTLLSYAVNFFIFLMGRIRVGAPPIIDGLRPPTLAEYADPLPQALVLTAIVISFALTGVQLVIALRARAETGTDHVDGREPAPEAAAQGAAQSAAQGAAQGAAHGAAQGAAVPDEAGAPAHGPAGGGGERR
ncbi:MAG: Na+/H+ antiporter subunit C [Burkholderiales bacterium]|nr:MAG: Na+/H+ antiporter subunit C [Burkholderiales bacterium]